MSLTSSVSADRAEIVEMIRDAGHELTIGPDFVGVPRGKAVEDQVRELVPGHDALVVGGVVVSREVIEDSTDLRVISRTGVGYDAVDAQAAAERRIPVVIAVSSNHTTVAEYAFGIMILLSRQMFAHHQIVVGGEWRREPNLDLAGKTLGIAGLGRIGRALTDRALAFEMNVIGCEAFPDRSFVESRGIELVEIDDLCSRSDFISLHLPVTTETTEIINAERLALMKPSAYVVNTARGSLIDENALYSALKDGQIAGAGLDVFVEEPPVGSPLLEMPNVIVSPHAAGVSRESQDRMGVQAVRNALDVLSGSWPREIVVNGIYSDA
ncbi:MAG: phosphoglycerate dehydrogenase [Gammaproteobacteria bacterium]|nr:phosphoglycerate dehydrogenase [Gammaproteobacteria bacterium]